MTTIFFSYSHKDEALRNELEAHLALLKHEGLVDSWHDRRIVAGDELDEAIFSQLETANIILLLVSSDFMSSNYCYSREMARAMERHNAQEAKVIPVILRHCDWTNAPFGKLMAVPRDAKPVTSWPDRDEAFTDVAKQIRQAVVGIRTTNAPSQFSYPRSIASSNVSALPRSSNLRLKQEFSEMDVDQFVRLSFDFICRFFEGSVSAINTRNPDVTGTFELIDSRRMAAVLYRSGKKITECSVRLDVRGRSNGIAFSYDSSAASNSYNEILMPEAGNQSLHFKSMGMAWGSGKDKQMSQEGAAEFLWELFIKQAQS
jgi:TIR domain